MSATQALCTAIPLAGTFPSLEVHMGSVSTSSKCYSNITLSVVFQPSYTELFLVILIFLTVLHFHIHTTTKHSIFHSFVLCMSLSLTPEMEAPWYKRHSLPSSHSFLASRKTPGMRGWHLYNLINTLNYHKANMYQN